MARFSVLTFCYTAESRVDFRQLVKDLARQFSCRIEMRQISSREEARRRLMQQDDDEIPLRSTQPASTSIKN